MQSRFVDTFYINSKLVATHAHGDVVGKVFLDSLCELDEQHIACVVTISVVDTLELVEVEDYEIASYSRVDGIVEMRFASRSVEELGEIVLFRALRKRISPEDEDDEQYASGYHHNAREGILLRLVLVGGNHLPLLVVSHGKQFGSGVLVLF